MKKTKWEYNMELAINEERARILQEIGGELAQYTLMDKDDILHLQNKILEIVTNK